RFWINQQTGTADPEQLRRHWPALQAEISIPSALADALQRRGAQIPSFPGTPIPTLPVNVVIGSSLAPLGFSVLVGRDVLRFFQIVYNGVEGMWISGAGTAA
ncbi:MAG: hypothetical protein AABZ83_00180, partial [candidate division NC10 bacterium]